MDLRRPGPASNPFESIVCVELVAKKSSKLRSGRRNMMAARKFGWLRPQILRRLRLSGSKGSFPGRALLFYKIPSPLTSAKHANELEIWDWVKALNENGYEVDLVDRTSKRYVGSGCYDLFLGLGTSASGQYFLEHGAGANAHKNYLIATTPHPQTANALRLLHLKHIANSYGIQVATTRLDPTESQISRYLEFADATLVYGISGSFSHRSFLDKDHLAFPFGPSSLVPSLPPRKDLHRNKFVLFAGNGLLAKGADLVIESFLNVPEAKLIIYGPQEQDFLDFLKLRLPRGSNIEYRGFLRLNRKNVAGMRNEFSAQVLSSPSEASATSVATLMSLGIVPIVNDEVGYPDSNRFGLGPFDQHIGSRISNRVREFLEVSPDLKQEMMEYEWEKSRAFTRSSFKSSISKLVSKL